MCGQSRARRFNYYPLKYKSRLKRPTPSNKLFFLYERIIHTNEELVLVLVELCFDFHYSG